MTEIDHITIGKISIPLPADPTPESMTLLAPPVVTVKGAKLTAFFRWKLVGVIAADDASGTLTYSTTTGTATSAAHQKVFAYQVTGEVSADLGAINTQIRSDFAWSTTESQVFNMSATETKEIEIDVDKGQIVAIWQIVCEYQRNAGGVKGIQNVSTHFSYHKVDGQQF